MGSMPMPGRGRWLLVGTLFLGIALGYAAHATICELRTAVVGQSTKDEMYESFRQVWWAIAEDYCPDGYRLIGGPDTPNDSHTVVVPNLWYGDGGRYDQTLTLDKDAWRTTQRSLGWVNDEAGFAIVVHMVFTTKDLGRGPLAFPTGNSIRRTRIFRPDWHFVGTRDNLIFFFQVLPLDEETVAGFTRYPNEWVESCYEFLEEFRRFLDERF